MLSVFLFCLGLETAHLGYDLSYLKMHSVKYETFEGDSFHTWQTKIKFTLMRKGLWNIVNGKEKKPSTREGEVNWITKDEKALSIIALGLSNEYIHHIDGMDTS